MSIVTQDAVPARGPGQSPGKSLHPPDGRLAEIEFHAESAGSFFRLVAAAPAHRPDPSGMDRIPYRRNLWLRLIPSGLACHLLRRGTVGARHGACTMWGRHFAAVLVSLALTVSSASATVLIVEDGGGRMDDYAARFRQVRQSGESVVIDGPCLSACTMVLGIVPLERICATSNAVLGFHGAWIYDDAGGRVPSASGTRELMNTYPATVRAWIAGRGGLTSTMIFVRGRQLAALVAPCSNESITASMPHAADFDVLRAGSGNDPRRASFDSR